jgi:hypothetical protein
VLRARWGSQGGRSLGNETVRALMRLQLVVPVLMCVLAGCHASVKRDALVGNYVYSSDDPADTLTDHDWERLTLKADGKYDLVHGGPTRAKSNRYVAVPQRRLSGSRPGSFELFSPHEGRRG